MDSTYGRRKTNVDNYERSTGGRLLQRKTKQSKPGNGSAKYPSQAG